jgi:hypothetical protein
MFLDMYVTLYILDDVQYRKSISVPVSLATSVTPGWYGWIEEFCAIQSMSLKEGIGLILLLPSGLAVLHGLYSPLKAHFQQKILVLLLLKGYLPHPQHFISSHIYIL